MQVRVNLEERCISSKEIWRGNFLHAFADTVALPDGTQAHREYVLHPGAVVIVPLLDMPDGSLHVVLERQYRYPVRQTMIEFPAGKLDPNEHLVDCAARELREETGYQAQLWAHAGVMHPVIAYSTEFIDIWFAKDLSPGPRQLDTGEFLEVFSAPPAQLLDWSQQGLVTDAKTLTCALWLQNVLSGHWPLNWQTAERWKAHVPASLAP